MIMIMIHLCFKDNSGNCTLPSELPTLRCHCLLQLQRVTNHPVKLHILSRERFYLTVFAQTNSPSKTVLMELLLSSRSSRKKSPTETENRIEYQLSYHSKDYVAWYSAQSTTTCSRIHVQRIGVMFVELSLECFAHIVYFIR